MSVHWETDTTHIWVVSMKDRKSQESVAEVLNALAARIIAQDIAALSLQTSVDITGRGTVKIDFHEIYKEDDELLPGEGRKSTDTLQ